jgi:hypothetical protein
MVNLAAGTATMPAMESGAGVGGGGGGAGADALCEAGAPADPLAEASVAAPASAPRESSMSVRQMPTSAPATTPTVTAMVPIHTTFRRRCSRSITVIVPGAVRDGSGPPASARCTDGLARSGCGVGITDEGGRTLRERGFAGRAVSTAWTSASQNSPAER